MRTMRSAASLRSTTSGRAHSRPTAARCSSTSTTSGASWRRWYRRDRVVAGFNFLNEPLDFGAPVGFEPQALLPAYRRWAAILRDERAEQIRVIEPPVTRNLGTPAHPEPFGPNAVYAPHLYTETFGLPTLKYDGDHTKTDADYALAASEAAGYGVPLWVGEYGGSTEAAGGFRDATELAIRHQLDAQDAHLAGGVVWAYFPTDNTFSLVDAAGNEKGALVDEWSRPYPQQTAGVPQALHYDVDTRELTYTFVEDRRGGSRTRRSSSCRSRGTIRAAWSSRRRRATRRRSTSRAVASSCGAIARTRRIRSWCGRSSRLGWRLRTPSRVLGPPG
jgi:hypothetical protein